MPAIEAEYLGDLRVRCTHLDSGAVIVTDAPKDNNGKGEAFSPTDLCATALGACAMTIMGIFARNHGLDITGARVSIEKKMTANPRRIGVIEVAFIMPDREYAEKDKKSLERAADTCPVRLTLHPEVEQKISFRWAR